MESIFDWSVILSIVGVLVIVTNIVVQVLKKLTWDKLPTNILAVLIAMALTLAAFFAYCEIKGVAIVWYTVVGAVVLGFFVAYAAMFGFDKLKEAIAQLDHDARADLDLAGHSQIIRRVRRVDDGIRNA